MPDAGSLKPTARVEIAASMPQAAGDGEIQPAVGEQQPANPPVRAAEQSVQDSSQARIAMAGRNPYRSRARWFRLASLEQSDGGGTGGFKPADQLRSSDQATGSRGRSVVADRGRTGETFSIEIEQKIAEEERRKPALDAILDRMSHFSHHEESELLARSGPCARRSPRWRRPLTGSSRVQGLEERVKSSSYLGINCRGSFADALNAGLTASIEGIRQNFFEGSGTLLAGLSVRLCQLSISLVTYGLILLAAPRFLRCSLDSIESQPSDRAGSAWCVRCRYGRDRRYQHQKPQRRAGDLQCARPIRCSISGSIRIAG
jgi:hypothetical protein